MPSPKPMAAPPPVTPRVTKDTELPVKKELVDPEEVKGVEYGTSRKEGGQAAGKKTGTAALRIPLNTGTEKNKSGGLNV